MTTDTKCRSWHQLGRRCGCGFLAIPARFYERNVKGEELSQGEAEGNYLAWLGSEEKPAYVNPPVMDEIRTETPNKRTVRTEIPERRTPSKPAGRPKKWASEADRLRAYRGRRG